MGKKSSKLFVGMDVHKDSIDISLAEVDCELRHYAGIGGDSAALMKAVRKLESLGKTLVFVYEAGPCLRGHDLSQSGEARACVLGGRPFGDPAPGRRSDQDRSARQSQAGRSGTCR